ncbi:MAG TPA: DUF3108 domain-containing protein [Caldimonas sp.]|nr:DUF3108 domain-containing protein [Caldimonas sp.]HEX4235566.1 DUF3108 domain-containing protein [Caldimonas sp.]
MLDHLAASIEDRAAVSELPARRLQARRRAGGLATSAVLVAVLHLAVLDGLGDRTRAAPRSATTTFSVRTVVAEPELGPAVQEVTVAAWRPESPLEVTPRPVRRPREPVATLTDQRRSTAKASAGSADLRNAPLPAMAWVSAPVEAPVVVVAAVLNDDEAIAKATPVAAAFDPSERSPPKSSRDEPAAIGAAAAGASRPASLPGAEDRPPPVYRTRLPPPVTLHYEVRRGLLSGEGQIRWQRLGDGYRLVLDASIAGLTLLLQTSEGAIDANGLAPVRFLDQRARRAAQAANFVRDAGKITFSGTPVEWPLLAGSQDRLSWMIQLAGIAAAQPGLLAEGGRITMAVAGARGDADVWTLHSVGVETVETRRGAVRAVKLVRDARSADDTSAEIWLDPEHSYLPARATQRNGSGAVEFDLLLERIDP